VVIGSGATAVTLIPALAATAEHVTMLQRSPTYIASLPAKDPIANVLRWALPGRYSGPTIRWYKALTTQASYQLSKRWPRLVKRLLRTQVERQLPAGYDVDTHFTPRYNPWDQRLCVVPNGDLFKAITAGAASVVTDQIDTFTEKGLLLRSGAALDADIIIAATGLELLFLGGIELSVDGEAVDLASKLTYKGMMLEGVPNLAIAVGYTNASWTLKCDLTCDYVCRLLTHMRATRVQQCTPVNRDASVAPQPLLGLTSGYVLRSAASFPKQGSKFPWQVHQSYLRDYRALKMSGIEDDAMIFSNPVRQPAPATAA
jgi:cation diffusion facilitator CzcD-associated flavoprotein CzcO